MRGAASGKFTCNLCGEECLRPPEGSERETASCPECQSTVRLRSLAALLSRELFGMVMTLPQFPPLKGIRGLGMSDLRSIAGPLAEKFDYTNTFYDHAPLFDVTKPDQRDRARYDFIVSSEVMEHVPPPVMQAFATLCGMLKPDGFLVFTTPYSLRPDTDERFSTLHEYALAAPGGRTVLVNRRVDGSIEVFEDLAFHGGHGSTIEMRLFSESALRSMLIEAGFSSVHFAVEDWPGFGVEHRGSWSLPIVARKGPFHPPTAEFSREYRDACERAELLEHDFFVLKTGYEHHISHLDPSDNHAARLLQSNREWAGTVANNFAARTQKTLDLERERNEVLAANDQLRSDLESRTEWARKVEGQLEEWTRWTLDLEREKNEAIQDFAARDKELQIARAELARLRLAAWTRLGLKLGTLKS